MCCDLCEHYFGCEEVKQQTACCLLCEDVGDCREGVAAGQRVIDDDDDMDYDDDGVDYDDDDDLDDDYEDSADYDDDYDDDLDDDDDDDDVGYLHDRYRPGERP